MWARVFVYVGGTAAIAVFAWGCWQRVSLWLKGRPERRTDRLPEWIALVLREALGQARTPNGLDAWPLCAWSNFKFQDVA